MDLVLKEITARRIINRTGIENAIRLTAAIGGSTNVALHLPAIGYEAGVPVPMTLFDELCRSTPHIAKMNPAAAPNVPDHSMDMGCNIFSKHCSAPCFGFRNQMNTAMVLVHFRKDS